MFNLQEVLDKHLATLKKVGGGKKDLEYIKKSLKEAGILDKNNSPTSPTTPATQPR